MGGFLGWYSDAPGMRVLSSLNNESQSLARRAWTAFWRLVYTALILYKGMKQNAPERLPDALKRKPHFQEHSGRENPLFKLAFIGDERPSKAFSDMRLMDESATKEKRSKRPIKPFQSAKESGAMAAFFLSIVLSFPCFDRFSSRRHTRMEVSHRKHIPKKPDPLCVVCFPLSIIQSLLFGKFVPFPVR